MGAGEGKGGDGEEKGSLGTSILGRAAHIWEPQAFGEYERWAEACAGPLGRVGLCGTMWVVLGCVVFILEAMASSGGGEAGE